MNKSNDTAAIFWHAFAHGVSQWPWWVWAAFVLMSVGAAWTRSPRLRRTGRRFGGW